MCGGTEVRLSTKAVQRERDQVFIGNQREQLQKEPAQGGEEDQDKMKGREKDDIHRGHRPRPSKKDFDTKGQSAGLRRRQQSTGHKRPQDVDQDTRGRSSSTSEPQRSASADVEETKNTERAPGSRTKHKRRR